MFDARLRPYINPPLEAAARRLAQTGLEADVVTWAGLAIGLLGAVAIATGASHVGLLLLTANRLLDGLDGALARVTTPTDRGGFIDIVSDFLVYAAIPLGFAVADPAGNGLAAATLLASFMASGATFLAFAATAAKRKLTTSAQGEKSMYYLAGLAAEGFETILALMAMCIWPSYFAVIAYSFAAICGRLNHCETSSGVTSTRLRFGA